MEKIAIALGGNRGDRIGFLRRATSRIFADVMFDGVASPVYETRPWGHADQGDFLNAVLVGWTDWTALTILSYLKKLERELGRTPGIVNGPREIDLDLIGYGNSTVDSEIIAVPHPRVQDRIFVLKPLADVWPDWFHPVLKRTAFELLGALPPENASNIRGYKDALVPN